MHGQKSGTFVGWDAGLKDTCAHDLCSWGPVPGTTEFNFITGTWCTSVCGNSCTGGVCTGVCTTYLGGSM